jgi:hypothetical protein
MGHDEVDRIDCCCEQTIGSDGEPVLIPTAGCELHWRQVIDTEPPPAHLFP